MPELFPDLSRVLSINPMEGKEHIIRSTTIFHMAMITRREGMTTYRLDESGWANMGWHSREQERNTQIKVGWEGSRSLLKNHHPALTSEVLSIAPKNNAITWKYCNSVNFYKKVKDLHQSKTAVHTTQPLLRHKDDKLNTGCLRYSDYKLEYELIFWRFNRLRWS